MRGTGRQLDNLQEGGTKSDFERLKQSGADTMSVSPVHTTGPVQMCTSNTSPASTFPRFNELPYELRHRIYDFIDPQRILHFRTNDSLDTYMDQDRELDNHLWLASPRPPPVVLSIDQEARTYGLKRYQSLCPPYQNLMVDWERDLWWLEHRNRTRPDYTLTAGNYIPGEEWGLSDEDKPRVKRVLCVFTASALKDPMFPSGVCSGISFWLNALSPPASTLQSRVSESALADVIIACRPADGEAWNCREDSLEMADGSRYIGYTETLEDWWGKLCRSKKYEEFWRVEHLQARREHHRRTEGVRLWAEDIKELEI